VQPHAQYSESEIMKSASLTRNPRTDCAQSSAPGDQPGVLAATQKAKAFLRAQSRMFSAIALAEGGDTDGAIELLQPAGKKKS
jgi:hypothetical protein